MKQKCGLSYYLLTSSAASSKKKHLPQFRSIQRKNMYVVEAETYTIPSHNKMFGCQSTTKRDDRGQSAIQQGVHGHK